MTAAPAWLLALSGVVFNRMLLLLFTILIFLLYATLLLYYRIGWIDLPLFKSSKGISTGKNIFVSVIIAARNEEKNISSCLESLLEQSYPKEWYEVIVVDDFSADNTAELVKSLGRNISLVSLQEILGTRKINSFKKKAIETAVAIAKGELIITTDADCISPPAWIETIVDFYKKEQPVFIAAPVSFHKERNFLDIFQSVDFLTLQGITGAALHTKFHNMCNGANLAYTKAAFAEVNGFNGIDNIASGDDMLLMHKIAARFPGRLRFLKSRDAIVQTNTARSFKEFINQRIRWASKSDKYPDKKVTGVLLLVYIFNSWILLLFLLSCFNHTLLWWTFALLICKIILELFFIYPVAVFFSKQKLLWWFPVAQPFHILYIVVAGWLGKFGSYTWKDRKVK